MEPNPSLNLPPLTDEERAICEWQMWVPGFGESGQRILKNSAVLISRCGGVGGEAATHLVAAGIGRLVLAHGGNLKQLDIRHQTLMRHSAIRVPRAELARPNHLRRPAARSAAACTAGPATQSQSAPR